MLNSDYYYSQSKNMTNNALDLAIKILALWSWVLNLLDV